MMQVLTQINVLAIGKLVTELSIIKKNVHNLKIKNYLNTKAYTHTLTTYTQSKQMHSSLLNRLCIVFIIILLKYEFLSRNEVFSLSRGTWYTSLE